MYNLRTIEPGSPLPNGKIISMDKQVRIKEKGTRKKQLQLCREATSSPSTKQQIQTANAPALENVHLFLYLGISCMEF